MPSRPMKICKSCEEENLLWARYCRGCQSPLEDAPVVAVRRPLHLPVSILVSLAICAMAFVVLSAIGPHSDMGTGFSQAPVLKVLWHKFYGSSGQEWIVGQVRNQSGQTLNHLLVAGEYYAEDGSLVTSASSPLDTASLAPGRVSHFKVAVPYNSEVQKSWFHFQTANGEQVPFAR